MNHCECSGFFVVIGTEKGGIDQIKSSEDGLEIKLKEIKFRQKEIKKIYLIPTLFGQI